LPECASSDKIARMDAIRKEIAPLGIKEDASVVVVTGAGISAESGIPTFRDKDGIWQKYNLEDVATPQGFYRNPDLVWQFYSQRRLDALKCEPNAGHKALVWLERYLEKRGRFLLVTQNVDGLHQRAGSKNIVTIHGSLFRTKCSNPSCSLQPFEDKETYFSGAPKCPECGSVLRPDVVWFGEYLDPYDEARAREAILDCDIFIAVGTSGVVQPVASYVVLASMAGATRILVNLEPPANLEFFTSFYQGKSGEILPILFGHLQR
jgi:NAD-dependent deacetylase